MTKRRYTYAEVLISVASVLDGVDGAALGSPIIASWDGDMSPHNPVARLALGAGSPGEILAWARVMDDSVSIRVGDHGPLLYLTGRLGGPLVEVSALVGSVIPADLTGREITVAQLEELAEPATELVPAEVPA